MQNIQMRNAEIMNNRRAMQAQQSTSIMAQAEGGGMDAFAMIFEQMALSLQEGQEGEHTLAVPEDVLAGMMGNSEDSDASEPDVSILSILASMFVQNPQWADFVQQDDVSAAEMVSALNLPADVKQFLWDARAAAQNLQQGNLPQTFEQVAQEQQPVQPSDASDETQAGMSNRFAELVSQPADESGSDPLEGLQDTFLRNVREARALLSQAKSGKDTQEIDIDKLQSDVASNRFNPLASLETRVARPEFNEPQAPEVDQQIQQGITENLLNGRKEFVIKLRPEGLGEVTVKLLERPGEASILSLITSSVESAKLINQKLSVLQEAMRPLQVQVNMAEPDHFVEASQAGSEAYNEHSFLADQQNQQDQNQKNQRSGKSSGKVFSLTDDSLLVEEVTEETAATDGLDTYI